MKTKARTIVHIIFGFIAGIIFSGVVISISSGEMMVKEMRSPYDFEKTVSVMSDRINAKEGWHVTEVIDQNKEVTLKFFISPIFSSITPRTAIKINNQVSMIVHLCPPLSKE